MRHLWLIACLAVAGCETQSVEAPIDESVATKPDTHARLAGTAWQPKDTNLTLKFSADSVSGSTGCNNFSGAYQAKGISDGRHNLSMGLLAMTRRACLDPDAAALEMSLTQALGQTESYKRVGDGAIVLYDGNGTEVLTLLPAG